MKKILIALILIICVRGLYGQDGFSVTNSKVEWAKIYETGYSFKELLTAIRMTGGFENIQVDSHRIIADTRAFLADYKGAGYTKLRTPLYIARSDIRGFVVIDYEPGQYRVVFKNIQFTQLFDDAISKMGEKDVIEQWALGKNQLRPDFKRTGETILNYSFEKHFKF